MCGFGPKRTCRKTQSMSLLGAKRTWGGALQMSAFDPKRTSAQGAATACARHLCVDHLPRARRRTDLRLERRPYRILGRMGARNGKTLLELCAASSKNIDPKVWNDYYAGVGEERRGALPFRVWQIFDEMVDFAAHDQMIEFVCAAGIVAHYIGDACQPLHISQYHHGRNPADTAHAKVHSVYETTMIGRHGRDLIQMIPKATTNDVPEIVPNGRPTGRDAAQAVVALMRRTVDRLAPLTIVNLFDHNMGRGQ